MISKGATNWDCGLKGACRGHNKEIVDLMISTRRGGATKWDYGLEGACRGANLDLVKLMMSKGANS